MDGDSIKKAQENNLAITKSENQQPEDSDPLSNLFNILFTFRIRFDNVNGDEVNGWILGSYSPFVFSVGTICWIIYLFT
jgi:hypothetical protein